MAPKPPKLPITSRALLQRLNRRLGKDGLKLLAVRGNPVPELGDWYAVDLARNVIVRKQVNLEAISREFGVLRDWEEVVD